MNIIRTVCPDIFGFPLVNHNKKIVFWMQSENLLEFELKMDKLGFVKTFSHEVNFNKNN